jgi:hypothetical protein
MQLIDRLLIGLIRFFLSETRFDSQGGRLLAPFSRCMYTMRRGKGVRRDCVWDHILRDLIIDM